MRGASTCYPECAKGELLQQSQKEPQEGLPSEALRAPVGESVLIGAQLRLSQMHEVALSVQLLLRESLTEDHHVVKAKKAKPSKPRTHG